MLCPHTQNPNAIIMLILLFFSLIEIRFESLNEDECWFCIAAGSDKDVPHPPIIWHKLYPFTKFEEINGFFFLIISWNLDAVVPVLTCLDTTQYQRYEKTPCPWSRLTCYLCHHLLAADPPAWWMSPVDGRHLRMMELFSTSPGHTRLQTEFVPEGNGGMAYFPNWLHTK